MIAIFLPPPCICAFSSANIKPCSSSLPMPACGPESVITTPTLMVSDAADVVVAASAVVVPPPSLQSLHPSAKVALEAHRPSRIPRRERELSVMRASLPRGGARWEPQVSGGKVGPLLRPRVAAVDRRLLRGLDGRQRLGR